MGNFDCTYKGSNVIVFGNTLDDAREKAARRLSIDKDAKAVNIMKCSPVEIRKPDPEPMPVAPPVKPEEPKEDGITGWINKIRRENAEDKFNHMEAIIAGQ